MIRYYNIQKERKIREIDSVNFFWLGQNILHKITKLLLTFYICDLDFFSVKSCDYLRIYVFNSTCERKFRGSALIGLEAFEIIV